MALLVFLDASNPASWPYTAGAPNPPPTPYSYWTDISGASYYAYPNKMQMANAPELVTISGSTKGLRMKAYSGGTYPNGTAVQQRGEMNLGGQPQDPNGDVGSLLTASKSYSISMWICFNQAPIAGSGSGGTDMPTTIFGQYGNNAPYFNLSCNEGDSVSPRGSSPSSDFVAVRYYTSPSSSAVAGTWIPDLGVWYLVTIVCENTSPTAGNLSLYVNGLLDATSPISGSGVVPFILPAGNYFNYYFVLNAGYYPNASPSPFDFGGDITFSTFKIFDTALTPAEIITEFNASAANYGYGTPSPLIIRVTLPIGMQLIDWADQIALDLDPYGAFGRLDNEAEWQDWAMQFIKNSSLKENFPLPYNFDNWRDWAERFCQTVQ